MSTVTIGGGGPRPLARIVSVMDMPTAVDAVATYEIRDGLEVVATMTKISHALALLPLIQSGE